MKGAKIETCAGQCSSHGGRLACPAADLIKNRTSLVLAALCTGQTQPSTVWLLYVVCDCSRKERQGRKKKTTKRQGSAVWERKERNAIQTGGLGKRSGELGDSCMRVVVGDGPSVCQSRYFCLFSAALPAARDTPHVIAGCLLSLAKKERESGVCVCE